MLQELKWVSPYEVERLCPKHDAGSVPGDWRVAAQKALRAEAAYVGVDEDMARVYEAEANYWIQKIEARLYGEPLE